MTTSPYYWSRTIPAHAAALAYGFRKQMSLTPNRYGSDTSSVTGLWPMKANVANVPAPKITNGYNMTFGITSASLNLHLAGLVNTHDGYSPTRLAAELHDAFNFTGGFMSAEPEEKKRKEKLSIYLAKGNSGGNDKLIKTENAKQPISLDIGFGEGTLYIKKEPHKPPPPWTKLFTSDANVPEDAFGSSNSVGAVLIYRNQESTFILTFGSGFHLIRDEAIERDFGLRVTLNSVEPDKLRSLDKANYDLNPLNSRTQSTKDVDIFELHIDSELEILYAVTGVSKEKVFGSHVTGRDALTIMTEVDLKGIPEILARAIELYNTKLPVNFEWVDNISRVKDSDDIDVLDLELNDALKDPYSGSFWLGEPEIVDWESQIGYSFDKYPKTLRHVILRMEDLVEYLQAKGHSLDVETLKSQLIHVNNSEYQSTKSWTAYRCLYAEIMVGGEQFILRNGTWFRVEPSFALQINKYLSDLSPCTYQFPPYAHDREEEYNLHVSTQDTTFELMDKKNTRIGGPYDKLEFCDLIKDGYNLVHVKYYRSSSTLSHLFSQGYVAAEAFIKDEDFREKLNQKLPASAKLVDTKQRPDASKYKLIYAIATTKKIPDELPFFSKVTLKNALKTLRALNFQVQLSTIPVDTALLVKKKCKPKAN